MKQLKYIVAIGMVVLTGLAVHGEVKVTVGHSEGEDASPEFKFKNVPSPSSNDAGSLAKFVVVGGEGEPNGGGLDKLHDGELPEDADQPAENFFFRAGTSGGRVLIDLGGLIDVKQVNTYSWHPGARAPQVYKLYAAGETNQGFNAAPKFPTNPETCGWKLVAKVDTRSKNPDDAGGQFGVSIGDTAGPLGQYRYLLLNIERTEDRDAFGNTFYSEIDVIDANAPAMDQKPSGQAAVSAQFVFKTADDKCEITINTSRAPELKDWAQNKLAPVMAEWYPKIAAMLSSEGFTAPAHCRVTLKPGPGVAYTTGAGIVANSTWLQTQLKGDATGPLVHEMVHVVQHYQGDGPGWLVEGIADYIRWFKYEPGSHGADLVWMRKEPKPFSPSYNDSYRVSANFLNWVTEHYDKKIVARLNAAMRGKNYNEALWKQYTGKTVQELGAEWKKDIEARMDARSAANIERAMELDAVDYATKPFTVDYLEETVTSKIATQLLYA